MRGAGSDQCLMQRWPSAVATDELKGEELEQWNACQSKVEELGFSADEAVKFLNKAFAWQKGYWGPEKPKPEAPSTAQVGLKTCISACWQNVYHSKARMVWIIMPQSPRCCSSAGPVNEDLL